MTNMRPEVLALFMDVSGLGDRQLAEKLGVKHPTVIRWRRGDNDIPQVASMAIDCELGNGSPGSATNHAQIVLRERWQDFVNELSREQLCAIADGSKAINYRAGDFYLDVYEDSSGTRQVYVGDVCGLIDSPIAMGRTLLKNVVPDELLDFTCEDLEQFESDSDFGQSLRSTLTLIAEAERSGMFRFDIVKAVLDVLCDIRHSRNDEED